jgi:predicted RNA polymerase sigma factor
MRPGLREDALRLGRILAELVPDEPEVHGLVALMEVQTSRSRARVGPGGEPVILLDQNCGRWDQAVIRRGLAALARAEALGGALRPYALQAAIAACHARARTAEDTGWPRIAALYDALARLAPSPVVELNRAVAVSMAFGPAAGLELIERLTADRSLRSYHLLPSAWADPQRPRACPPARTCRRGRSRSDRRLWMIPGATAPPPWSAVANCSAGNGGPKTYRAGGLTRC